MADFFQRFQRQISERPGAVAVACGEDVSTYANLERRAAAIACHLEPGSLEVPSLVAVYLPSNVDAVAAILAIVGRGHGFLGIGAGQPIDDVVRTLEYCRPGVMVTDAAGRDKLAGRFDGRVVVIDAVGEVDNEGWEGVWVGERHPFLCVFSTSGSTGEPKAIVLTHAVVCADLERAVRDTGIGSGDRLDQRFSLSFSAYLSPLVGSLGTGGEMHVMPEGCVGSEEQAAWMEESGISYSTLTPGMWRHLCRGLGGGRRFESVRFIGLSGDGFSAVDIGLLKRCLPAEAIVQNAVASSEARTYLQSFCRVEAVSEERLLVMDPVREKGASIDLVGEEGDEGEVVLGTALRSPGDWKGYRDRPTEAVGTELFRTGDWAARCGDGRVRFLGRRSDFVKIRGYRVSLKRTENWLLQRPEIVEAVCEAVVVGGEGVPVLVAFCRAEGEVSDEMREGLKVASEVEFPGHQRPDRWEFLSAFPQTHTGKTDRRRLVEDLQQRLVGRAVSRVGEGEAWLREIWRGVLGHDDFADDRSFFEVGGDSLAAHDLALAIGARVGRRVAVSEIYERPTFSEQAGLTGADETGDEGMLKCLRPGEKNGALFLIPPFHSPTAVFSEIVDRLPEGRAVYGIEIGAVDVEDSERPIELLARLAQDSVAGVAGSGELVLCGYSVGGLVAWELARRLMEQGGYRVKVVLLDTYRYFTELAEEERCRVARRRRHWSRVFDLAMLFLRPGVSLRKDLWEDFVVQRVFGGHREVLEDGEADELKREALELMNQRLGLGYRVPPLGCEVVLIRARRQGLLVNALAEDLGWTPVCEGGFSVFHVGCSHQELLKGKHAGDVASVLREKLG